MKTFCLVALCIVVSCNCLDREIARLAHDLLSANRLLSQQLSGIPDNLLVIVIATAALSFCMYLYRITVGKRDAMTDSFLLLAVSVPASYAAKTWFKYVFGRVDPRQWLTMPELYGFHWFQGGNFQGFPSGHMAVFTTIAAAMWRYCPRHRNICFALMLLLAGALIVTDYHFLSDVIAGAYLGLLVEIASFRAIRLVSQASASRPDRLAPDGERL
jgi:membrane-associated phospholipid phosphatase